jgi:hypothetical protein
MHSDTNISSCLRLLRKMRIAAAVKVAQCVAFQINAELAAVLLLTIAIKSGKKVREKH